ncbi:hypothetical protein [Streptomyces sp. NPDC003077]|uniref:hypothetical protein n=1 Tax=Streptomyces sp. NPDC003077 TaxID=3154443 RepID=UPI0033B60713
MTIRKALAGSLGAAVLAIAATTATTGTAHAAGSAKGRWDCTKGWFCGWDATNYRQNVTWTEVRAFPEEKCGKGSWKPRNNAKLRSAWNRDSKHTWYGLDKNNKTHQILRKYGQVGSLVPNISSWKSITKWCWR